MKKVLRRISSFGLSTYLRKKLFDFAPSAYQRLAKQTGAGFVRTAYGVEMVENWHDATFRMCVFGGHGAALSNLLKGMETQHTFLDIGANQGLYSLLAANNPNCTAVVAFEPVPETFDLLGKNIARADMGGKVRPVMAAISSRTGVAKITVPEDHSGGASLSTRKESAAPSLEIKTIDANELAELIPDQGGLFVKIDVEGHEATVLQELLKLDAARRITHLFCEIDLKWVDFEQIAGMLRNAGLDCLERFGGSRHFDILVTRSSPVPTQPFQPLLDHEANT